MSDSLQNSSVNAMGRFNYLKIALVPGHRSLGLGRGSPLAIVDTELQIVTNGQTQDITTGRQRTGDIQDTGANRYKQLPDNTQSLSFWWTLFEMYFCCQNASNCLPGKVHSLLNV